MTRRLDWLLWPIPALFWIGVSPDWIAGVAIVVALALRWGPLILAWELIGW